MTASKKTTTKKTTSASRRSTHHATRRTIKRRLIAPFASLKRRAQELLARRPHRSFRRTRRRDYVRPLKLPGYWAFTNFVRKTVLKNKSAFIWLVICYGVLVVALVGLASQDNYTTLADTLRSTGGSIFGGNWGDIGQASLLVLTGVTGGFNETLSETQQVFTVLIILLTWLTTVWLLRAQLSGGKPKLRQALYSAGAPILSTFIVVLVAAVQLLPLALAVAGFAAAASSGVLAGGIEAMVLWALIALLVALSLYWITSTLIALVVVTLPGMYPLRAVKIAGDLVIGRRLRILLRLLWLGLTVAVLWVVCMVPVILFDTWIKGVFPAISGVPLVPVTLLVVTSLTVTWAASYIYLLYRRVVDDDAAPA